MARRHNRQSSGAIDRRSFLKAGGSGAVAVTLAGCLGGNDRGGQGGNNGSGGGGQGGNGSNGTQSGNADMDPSQIPKGGTYTVGLPEAPKGLNPLATSSSYSFAILDFIYEGDNIGTTLTPKDFDVKPSVYTDWTIENTEGNSPKPDVYFNVRQGLTFNDGEELTIDDVVFTYNYMLETEPGRYFSTIEPIESVEKASGNQWDVHMKLNRVVGTYDSSQLQLPILPQHVWSNVNNYQQYEPTAEGGPVGLGPGRVTTFSPDTAVEITFRDDYKLSSLDWVKQDDLLVSGGPFLEKLRFQVFGSQNALNQALVQGDIDATYLGLDSPQQIEQVKQNQNQSLISGPDSGFSYVGFNLRRTPLDDATFRQVFGFAFDDFYWTENLKRGYAIEGDFVTSPGYVKVRPETGSDQKLLTGPSTQALTFRATGPESSQPNVQGIRNFLTSGQVISGQSGTFVGQQYPGSITGVTASQTEARHDYSFGPVESQVLQGADNADQEIRVNGQTIPEIRDGPLVLFIDPPADQPQEAKALQRLVRNLHAVGIPITTQVLDFNTMLDRVYAQEDFDIYPMGWGSTSPFAVSSLYSIFHSDNADPDGSSDTLLNNSTGYGLEGNAGADQLISQARSEIDAKKRNDLARQAIEKIYLDAPYMVLSYDRVQWPVNSADFSGYIQGLTDPGGYQFSTEMTQVHKKQQQG